MNIIVAMDSFKGCLTSQEAGRAVERGVLQALPHASATVLTVSDGGDGMLEAFARATCATSVDVETFDPLMRPITAQYAITPDGKTALIEMARASGLTLLAPSERNPLRATTHGTGILVADALRRGCNTLIVGLGGSATSDAGMGMLRALGAEIGENGIDTSHFLLNRYPEATITIAGDVDNPLCGPRGAACVYGPQKGATPAMVQELDRRAAHFASLTASHTGCDLSDMPGAGAAGGLGFALMAYCRATMRSGIELLLDLLHFDDLVANVDLVITGEGAADRQTLMGKAPTGIMRRAQAHGVPTALLAGRVSDRDALLQAGFSTVRCIHDIAPNTPNDNTHNDAHCSTHNGALQCDEDPLSPIVSMRRLAATACVITQKITGNP